MTPDEIKKAQVVAQLNAQLAAQAISALQNKIAEMSVEIDALKSQLAEKNKTDEPCETPSNT